MEPLLFISDPQPEQSSRINNIEHTIPLVNKPKLAYTYIEWKTIVYLNKDYRDIEIQEMHLYCSANDSMNKGTQER